MANKKKSKRSIVPLKLQIPLAMLLGIVFILMLSSRLKGRRTAEDAPARPETHEMVTAEAASSDAERRVDALISKISKKEPKPEHGPLPTLAGDPFVKRERPSRRAAPDQLEHVQGAQEDNGYSGQSREGFVGSLTLRATLIDGDKKFVLINDTLYGENDTIGAFKIVEIRERSATLKDDRGPVLLEMKGDDLS